MYAVFASGGKQYRVAPGDTVRVEKLAVSPGDRVELGALLIARDGEIQLGAPLVGDAKIIGHVIGHGLGPKIRIFKKKRCKQYRRTKGHRQAYTAIRIEQIA